MAKTVITAHDERHVTISFDDATWGERVTMEIWAPIPREGGYSYVRYNGDRQLCAGLSGAGSTLSYKDGTQLIDLVRREYRAMRASEKREAARRECR